MRSSTLALAALLATTLSAAPVVIDTFASTQGLVSVGPGTQANPLSNDAGVSSSSSLGGARNIGVTRVAGDGFDFVNVSTNLFEMNSAAADNATGKIIWDGDTNGTVNAATGLGGVDLTAGGLNTGLRLRARSDVTGTIYITIFTSATSYSTVALTLPGQGFGSTPFTEFFLPFATFALGANATVTSNGVGFNLLTATGTANFTSVTAITLLVDGTGPNSAGLDTQIQLLQADTESSVPEPMTLALAGAGLGVLGILRRRRA